MDLREAGDSTGDLKTEKYFSKKLDTRTFTRPKKRILHPVSCGITDEKSLCDKFQDLESIKIPENPFNNFSIRNESSISTGPLHFKLSDPVINNSFDKILLTASDGYDSFQNMSPPSLMNSLCSSSFLTLMDSSYAQNIVPNDGENRENINIDKKKITENISLIQLSTANQTDDQRINDSQDSISVPSDKLSKLLSPDSIKDKTLKNKSFSNITPEISSLLNKTCEKSNFLNLNDSFVNSSNNLNSTFKKNNSKNNFNITYQTITKSKNGERNLNNTYSAISKSREKLNSTYTNLNKINIVKKIRNIDAMSESLKKSCPEINQTYLQLDKTLSKSRQKMSDSQPNLSKQIKHSVLNQSMELLNSSCEQYCNTRSGSSDSLEDKSSSISSSSKGSGSKMLNVGDLDNLAKLQEQSKYQKISVNQKSLFSFEYKNENIKNFRQCFIC